MVLILANFVEIKVVIGHGFACRIMHIIIMGIKAMLCTHGRISLVKRLTHWMVLIFSVLFAHHLSEGKSEVLVVMIAGTQATVRLGYVVLVLAIEVVMMHGGLVD